MNWSAPVELFREYPGKMATAAATIAVATILVFDYVWDAQVSHAQTAENKSEIDQLAEIQKSILEEKKLEALQEKQKMDYIKAGCLTGKIKDQNDCAKVGIKVP